MEKARLKQDNNDAAVRSINDHIVWLKSEEKRLSATVMEMIQSRSDWRRRYEIIKSYPGAGPVLASTMTAELPELGRIGKSKIAALVGIAPIPKESGQITDRRRFVGGRKTVRNALYVASISAQQANPTIRYTIERLVSAGKPRKVARVAAMRKMLITIDAMVRDDRLWSPSAEQR
jgi:transposase